MGVRPPHRKGSTPAFSSSSLFPASTLQTITLQQSPFREDAMTGAASSQPVADRNLLFGILALQMDFVSRDALIAAMNAWVLQKSESLGQLLCAQGKLSAERRALLEALVQE